MIVSNSHAFVETLQTLLTDLIPDETTFTKEGLESIANHILDQQYEIESHSGNREYLQTVRVVREQRTWVPVTVHVQVNEQGLVDMVRIHAPRYVVETKRF